MKDYNVKLNTLKNRLSKLGIEIDIWCNYPWIYLHSVNGNKVKEKLDSEHAFTIAFLPVRVDRPFYFTNIKEMFKIIRKYR